MKHNRKRILLYLALLAAIIAVSVMMPYGIRAMTELVKNRILSGVYESEAYGDDTEAETADMILQEQTERQGGTLVIGLDSLESEEDIRAGISIGRGRQIPESEDDQQLQAQEEAENVRREMLKILASYKESFHPELKEADKDIMERFVGENAQLFLDAAAEYAFGYYGSEYPVTKIYFDYITADDDTIITCLLELYTEEDAASDLVLCTYNKELKQYIFQ